VISTFIKHIEENIKALLVKFADDVQLGGMTNSIEKQQVTHSWVVW